jgi:peptide/nickel transport system substrate-binding protein
MLILIIVFSMNISPPTITAQVTPPREKNLIIDIVGGKVADPTNWNWLIPGGRTDQGFSFLIQESPFVLNLATGEFIPWLAERYEYNSDYTKLTLYLRKGIKWSDGVNFTADDVVFGYRILIEKAPKLSYSSVAASIIKSVDKIDDYKVEFTFYNSTPRFHIMPGIGLTRAVIPKHIWEGKDPLTFKFYPPVGTGPYELISASETAFIYKRRDNWWATELFGVRPAPEYVSFIWYGPPEVRVMKMATHDLDVQQRETPTLILKAKETNPYLRMWKDVRPYGWPAAVPICLSLPWNKYPYTLPEVRRALSYLINRSELVEVAYEGAAVPAEWGPLPRYKAFEPFIAASKDILDKADWMYTYAPKKAEEIFRNLGFRKGTDGIWITPNGTRLTLTVNTHSATITALKLGELVAQQLRDGGIDATMRGIEWATFIDILYTGTYESSIWWSSTDPDPFLIFNIWHSKNYVPIGSRTVVNTERYRNPGYDRILDEWSKTSPNDLEKVKSLFREIMTIWVNDMPWGIPLVIYCHTHPRDTYYWVEWPSDSNPWIHPWVGGAEIFGYPSPTTGEWVGGIRPRTIDYSVVYFLKDTPKFRGIDLSWYGPFKKGDAYRIPADDAEFWIRRGYASYTPSTLEIPGLESISQVVSSLEAKTSELSASIGALRSDVANMAGTLTALVAGVVIEAILILILVILLIRKRPEE